jgi:thioredoxin-like negative regulator of GroEL
MLQTIVKGSIWAGVLALGALLLPTDAAQAAWLRAETPNFIVYGELPEEELRKRALQLEHFDEALRFLGGVREPPTDRKPEVYLVPTSQIADVLRRQNDSILGFYKATTEGAAFVASTENIVLNDTASGSRIRYKEEHIAASAVLQHEYAHHFMFQFFNAAYPAWYREGFAEYVSTIEMTPEGLTLGKASLGRVVGLDDWVSAKRFLQLNTKSPPEEQYSVYVQGWIATHYFYSKPERTNGLIAFLSSTAKGEPVESALKAATGLSFDELDREIRTYMSGKVVMRTFQGWKPAEAEITISPVSPGQSAVLLDDVGVRLALGGLEARVKALRKAHESFPQDRDVTQALIRALIANGEHAEASPLLAGLPESPDVLKWRADVLVAEARASKDAAANAVKFQEARKLYARANRLDPNHIPSLIGYADALPEADQISENGLNIRLLAHSLAPQVSGLATDAAFQLMRAKRFEEAIPLLNPVAYNAHGGALTQYAQALLSAAESQQPPIRFEEWTKAEEAKKKQK